jgi:hypothetical protein
MAHHHPLMITSIVVTLLVLPASSALPAWRQSIVDTVKYESRFDFCVCGMSPQGLFALILLIFTLLMAAICWYHAEDLAESAWRLEDALDDLREALGRTVRFSHVELVVARRGDVIRALQEVQERSNGQRLHVSSTAAGYNGGDRRSRQEQRTYLELNTIRRPSFFFRILLNYQDVFSVQI